VVARRDAPQEEVRANTRAITATTMRPPALETRTVIRELVEDMDGILDSPKRSAKSQQPDGAAG
jgi:hypothetical protein